ncbi:MAG: imidazole glycerol phosphate synthase subunit HisH [Deltaproteobacteria bacterium]|nr:imidazole glycerol phosphate synthase subunit HisH [Deltaproteobacteria bacterium]
MSTTIDIVLTNNANIASVRAAIARLGYQTRDADRRTVEDATHLILPGVGTLASARDALDEQGLLAPLAQRLAEPQAPTLAICVGMQLLSEGSEESPGVAGFGLLSGIARAFPPNVRRPQFGWNRIAASDNWLASGYVYFANSFALVDDPGPGWQTAWATHGVRFLAATRRGRMTACQFHPELSGAFGQKLIADWIKGDA